MYLLMIEKIIYFKNKIYKKLELIYWRIVAIFYLKVEEDRLKIIISKNRKYLESIDNFLTIKEYEKNNYGIPLHIYENINKEINNKLTYSDLIIYLTHLFKGTELNYLEIGVSVLKNFMQINNQLENSNLVAYDINNIVTKFSSDFTGTKENVVGNFYQSNKGKNNICYFKGDVLNNQDTQNFNEINKFKFDFIMSDALHTKEGIISEYENIINGNLNDKFILYYDDLDFPELENAATQVLKKLQMNYENLSFYTFWIYGWVGQHEKMHKNGFITNLPVKKYLDAGDIRLPFLNRVT